MNKYTEVQLINGLREGVSDCYQELFHQKYLLFYNFIVRMVKDRCLAEDMTQNIFMKIWTHRTQLNESLSIHNYLYVLAKHEICNYYRSQHSLQSPIETLDQEFSVNDTESRMIHRETLNILMQAIENMPPQRREIFKMSRIDQLSNKEISEKLNISIRTVEKHIELAVKTLGPLFQTLYLLIISIH